VLGCGYVGAEFARQARAAGHNALGIVRSEASRDKLRAEGIAAEAFDIQAGDWSACRSSSMQSCMRPAPVAADLRLIP